MIIGGTYSALGAARNLAKHGVAVHIMASERCIAQYSRSVRSFHRCPPADDESRFVEYLQYIAADRNINGYVLFPIADEYVRILAQHRGRLSTSYIVTTPQWDVVKFFYDKRLTHCLAMEQGVPVPETCSPGSVDALGSLNLQFPVVVKPAISTHLSSVTKKKAYRADGLEELIELCEMVAAIMDPSEILIQELIPGRGDNLYSFVGFFEEGRTVAGFSARRPRQHPMEFGRASTFVETVHAPELEALATQFLQGVAYTGLAEVEFMYDPKHARFELIEVNPRIWGWHSIAFRAGIDLPYIAYAHAVGQDVHVGPLREDVKWVRLLTDVPTAVVEIVAGRLTVRKYLESLRGDTEFAVLSLADPLPFLADVLLIPQFMKQRGF